MGDARWNDDDIARMHFLNNATFTAQLHSGRPAINPQHFVGSAVVMVIRVNPVAPTATPAIGGKELFKDRRWVMSSERHCHTIQEQWQPAVGKPAIILQHLHKHIRLIGVF